MKFNHAFGAGLRTPVHPNQPIKANNDLAGLPSPKNQAAGHISTSAAIETQNLDFASFSQALQFQDTLAGLPALVAKFGCGIEQDLPHMSIKELMGLYTHLTTLKRGLA